MTPNDDKNGPAATDSGDAESTEASQHKSWFSKSLNPFRIATLRGLGLLLPPLLTIIFFFWAWNTVERAVLQPVLAGSRYLIVWSIDDTQEDSIVKTIRIQESERIRIIDGREVFIDENGKAFRKVVNGWIPLEVINFVDESAPETQPVTAKEYYHEYVRKRFLRRALVIPAFLAAFVAFLYLMGKLLAAGVGRIMWRTAESIIHRVPIIRNVYSSVKQVTDFAFNETEVQFNRVVAVEYPRKGIWSMGFVTGESLLDIRETVGEPMLSVLMPTSPMPATGFTISIPKSEAIDLNITIDQAVQFCVSCGVVVPAHQQAKSTIEGEFRRRFDQITTAETEGGISEPADGEATPI